ncbi:hypothetical protein LGW65_09530, partial [Streptococcus mutans]|nr:hypothetical protein [Streptococcus mutans]
MNLSKIVRDTEKLGVTIIFCPFKKEKGRHLVNCTPKVRQKKSNFWGVFIMKLTYEDKVLIYELKNQG